MEYFKNMPLYRTFMYLAPGKEGQRNLRAKTIDLDGVESWEFVADGFTKVTMRSGDKFTIKFPILDFGNIIMGTVDAYGTLFTFNSN